MMRKDSVRDFRRGLDLVERPENGKNLWKGYNVPGKWPGRKKESHAGSLRGSHRTRPAQLMSERTRGLPLTATLVVVLMVPVFVGVLVGMRPGLVGVLLPVMAMGATFVAMFVLMFVLVMATHKRFTPLFINHV